MRAIVDSPQAPGVDVAVDLGRRERAVAEELLDHAQVGAALEQVGGEGVPQAVRVGKHAPDHARVEPAASRGDEQRVLGASREFGAAFAEIQSKAAGDEVVLHANQASYEDPEVHGLDPLAAPSQLGWGYQTTWGSFAQFAKVQAQQLLPKPPQLSWVDSSAYAVTYFTAYRMLIDQCGLQAGDDVLIWGAGGGLGVFAAQLCRAAGANAVGVVSSPEKGELAKRLGAVDCIDRREFAGMMRRGDETAAEERERFKVSRAFVKRVKEILGDSPRIVFEHVGRETFPTSVLAAKPFGKIVTCGATTGYSVDFDVRYLWMRQKEVIGSHAFNAYEAWRANELIAEGRIRPVLWRAMAFGDLPEAHRLIDENRHLGKISIMVGAGDEEEGRTAPGLGAIRAGVEQ